MAEIASLSGNSFELIFETKYCSFNHLAMPVKC